MMKMEGKRTLKKGNDGVMKMLKKEFLLNCFGSNVYGNSFAPFNYYTFKEFKTLIRVKAQLGKKFNKSFIP